MCHFQSLWPGPASSQEVPPPLEPVPSWECKGPWGCFHACGTRHPGVGSPPTEESFCPGVPSTPCLCPEGSTHLFHRHKSGNPGAQAAPLAVSYLV